ncbi:type IX secretion system protein PorG [Flavobacterium subsaxonicum]|uniref:Inorganic polyphosphate kinase n=1 Tax=Flavobacterium subsaxonicum WB 4.1-42 = DSM 21790 TaxID=1121898 RepID=A0A0A2MFI6_9FLAO|nr:DUF6089 family protein [Flavobacterium subsaxonicum]KGO91049.1 inorganic polyphosphate kinase [Flavobacterium subsaxonicum WB 4.1-42 = DSM 21790]
MKRILFVLFLIVTATQAQAQINELGLFVGGANYIGDIGPTTYVAPEKLALGLVYKWNRSPRHAWRASATYGRITSNDDNSDVPGRKQRGKQFENEVKEVSLGLEFNFLDFNLHEEGFKMTPYIYGGLSYFMYDENIIESNSQRAKDVDNGSGLAIPMTVGVKAHIAKNFVLGFEVGARYTFTDNLDGSNPSDNKYANLRIGNLESNDWYVFSGFTLTYTFGIKPCYCSQ